MLGGRRADLPAAEDGVLLHTLVFSEDDKFTFGQSVFLLCLGCESQELLQLKTNSSFFFISGSSLDISVVLWLRNSSYL